MAALQGPELTKLHTWVQTLVKDALVPCIRQGQAAKGAVSRMCSTCLETYSLVDYADLNHNPTSTLALAMSVWRATPALLAPKPVQLTMIAVEVP